MLLQQINAERAHEAGGVALAFGDVPRELRRIHPFNRRKVPVKCEVVENCKRYDEYQPYGVGKITVGGAMLELVDDLLKPKAHVRDARDCTCAACGAKSAGSSPVCWQHQCDCRRILLTRE